MANGSRWLITGYTATWESTRKKIVLTTDVPVHLTKRVSTAPQVRHERTTFIRGMPVTTDPHFSYSQWTDIEQEEPGDTLTHTIYQPRWPYCTWRFYFFKGTVGGVPSPSRSPFLKEHAPEVAPGPPPMGDPFTEGWNQGELPDWLASWWELWSIELPDYPDSFTEQWGPW